MELSSRMTRGGPNAMTAMWERDYHLADGELPKQSSSIARQ
jgi:hypothetical protein